MRADVWVTTLREKIGKEFALSQLPLGEDDGGRVVLSHRKNRQDRFFHTCVTGKLRTAFIIELVRVLASLYGEGKASFLVLSQKSEYAELLSVRGADITVPYLRTEKQFSLIKNLALSQAAERKQKPDCSTLFVIVDGWENFPFVQKDNTLSSFRQFLTDLSGGAQVVSGVDFAGSIFSGFEGAFVGVGNSLVSVDEKGKADVTYVGEDCVLDYPQSIRYAEKEGK